jgi:glycosyltransferase involved in cell wall biosynthesis
VWNASRELGNQGFDTTILTGGSVRRGLRRVEIEGRTLIELPYLPGRRFPFLSNTLEEALFNANARRWLRRHAREYDVVHIHGRSGCLYAGSNRRERTATVWTVHGLIEMENRCFSPDRTIAPDLRLHQALTLRAERRALRRVDRVVALSAAFARRLQQARGIDLGDRLCIIPNGVALHEPASPASIDRNLLLFVGRLHPVKGLTLLIDALHSVRPEPRLLVEGEGDQHRRLEELVRDGGLTARVRFAGGLDSTEVRDLMIRANALILPSRYESQGLALLEANACGRPVLAPATPEVCEIVSSGDNGDLFDPGSSASMAAAIDRLFADPVRADRMGAAGRQLIEREYSWDVVGGRLARLYRSVSRPETRFEREAS